MPSNIYVNLAHIDGMQATLNMAKRKMAVSKETSQGVNDISNIPFIAASSHDGLASVIYQKNDIHKQVIFKIQLYLVVFKRSIKAETSEQ